jgi:hypothetical protein
MMMTLSLRSCKKLSHSGLSRSTTAAGRAQDHISGLKEDLYTGLLDDCEEVSWLCRRLRLRPH